MKRIFKSCSLIKLASNLAGVLDSQLPDPLTPQQIVVPNLDTSRWLKLFLAEKNGVAANIEFILPADWQWRQIRKLYPDLPALLPSDPGPMHWSLLHILSDENVRKKFPVLDRYITNRPDEAKKVAVSQLAKQIASVFDQYLVYRPGMVLEWQKGVSGPGSEKWQSDLWRILDNRWKNLHNNELRYNKAELYNQTLLALKENRLGINEPLLLFNPGLTPLPLVRYFDEYSKKQNVYLFLADPSVLSEVYRNEFLIACGAESQRIRELYTLGGAETESDFELKTGNSMLGKIKRQIIKNLPSGPEGGTGGVVVKSCHSPLREVEVLHQFLLGQFENDAALNPEDVLVVTPDPERYQPYIDAVFGTKETGLPLIPYHLSAGRQQDGSGVQEAFLKLLSLPGSRFGFSAVMDFFEMKPVRERFGVSASEVSLLRGWMEDNHVVWGLSSGQRGEWGQPEEALQTWRSAIERGWLGQWMGGKAGDFSDDTLLYHGIKSGSEQELWASFSLFLRELEQIHQDSKKEKSCSGWCIMVENWIDRIMLGNVSQSVEYQLVNKILKTLGESAALGNCDLGIPFSLMRNELIAALEAGSAGAVQFTRGVVFSSMVPVRSIPFRIIALIGLNENVFPRRKTAPDFDLMAKEPGQFERNRKDEDRNLFLQSILAAGDLHYVSYVGQSPVDNEPIPPSPVVSEWVDHIALNSNLKPQEIIQKEALTSFSPGNFAEDGNYSEVLFQAAQSVASDGPGSEGVSLTSLPLNEVPAIEVSKIEDLTRFFGNPLRYFFDARLGVSLRDHESGKDEFEVNHLEKHLIFQRVLEWRLDGADPSGIERILLNSGALPAGWPGRNFLESIHEGIDVAFKEASNKEFTLSYNSIEISVELQNSYINDFIDNYSREGYLNISASSLSGRLLIRSWIKHLFWQMSEEGSGRDSCLLCELKKKPKWRRFKAVPDPGAILEELMAFYTISSEKPPVCFPNTSWAYELALRDSKKNEVSVAKNAFEGNEFAPFGDRNDPAVALLMGESVQFFPGLVHGKFQELMAVMADYLEDLK